MQKMNEAIDHLKNHQTYPATRDELMEECNKLSDFSQDDKKYFMDNLPEGTYDSAEEVIRALGWERKAGRMEDQGASAMA